METDDTEFWVNAATKNEIKWNCNLCFLKRKSILFPSGMQTIGNTMNNIVLKDLALVYSQLRSIISTPIVVRKKLSGLNACSPSLTLFILLI